MSDSAKTITIRDVAKLAGVTTSTVSRVLNGLDKVSDETRDKVQRAADELNYVPNAMAVSVVTGKSNIILIIIPDLTNDYYTAIAQGIETVLQRSGYYSMIVTLHSADSNGKPNGPQFKNKFSNIVDGVIVLPDDDDLEFYRNWDKPIVIIDRYVLGSGFNAVISANFSGAYQLIEELIKSNHRHIAAILGPKSIPTSAERLRGFKAAMMDYSVPYNEDYFFIGELSDKAGYECTNKLLDMPEPPTAIFAGNNQICYGCIDALHERGIEIGKDISLVGFDEHLLARYVPPGITVAKQNPYQMGVSAAERLLELLSGNGDITVQEQVMHVEIIRRGSVKHL